MTALNSLISAFGSNVVRRTDVANFIATSGIQAASVYKILNQFKVGHGTYQFTKEKSSVSSISAAFQTAPVEISDDEIADNISSRFQTLSLMTNASVKGINRSMIVSGPGGLGKSYTVVKAIESLPEERVITIKGFVRPTGLYHTLYNYRHKGCVVVFDDCDSIFSDETALNLLKAACDSSEKRRLMWLSARNLEVDGEELPSVFDFEGTVIFITNLDFDANIQKGSKLAPHFEAMISRSHYVDLGIKTKRDYIVRIKQVAPVMLKDMPQELADEIVNFIDVNQDKMRELSLRMVKKLADLVSVDRQNWKLIAKTTCMKV
jgi:hypothetical protein